MDQAEIDNWAKIAESMEGNGDTESWFYLRARAIADGKQDPMPNVSQLMSESVWSIIMGCWPDWLWTPEGWVFEPDWWGQWRPMRPLNPIELKIITGNSDYLSSCHGFWSQVFHCPSADGSASGIWPKASSISVSKRAVGLSLWTIHKSVTEHSLSSAPYSYSQSLTMPTSSYWALVMYASVHSCK